mmetsp:Transcript_63970/g.187665  ORF Transcript_63970/g.187665 Transcript_63970/m.187665 type:complete len:210 (+) Transcript_63970:2032-2661(+)
MAVLLVLRYDRVVHAAGHLLQPPGPQPRTPDHLVPVQHEAWVGRDAAGDGAVLAAEVGEEASQVHRRAVLLLFPDVGQHAVLQPEPHVRDGAQVIPSQDLGLRVRVVVRGPLPEPLQLRDRDLAVEARVPAARREADGATLVGAGALARDLVRGRLGEDPRRGLAPAAVCRDVQQAGGYRLSHPEGRLRVRAHGDDHEKDQPQRNGKRR